MAQKDISIHRNCRVVSRDTEDYYDKKTNKPKRRIIITKECDVVQVKVPVNDISKGILEDK
jgi:hypothetical protein